MFNGKGTLKDALGVKYICEWVDGLKSGTGEIIWKDGTKFFGTFKKGQKDGYCVYTYPSNSVIAKIEVNYEEGKPVDFKIT